MPLYFALLDRIAYFCHMDKIWALDMYQTAGVGVLALLLGISLTHHVSFLKKFCIPAPVSGGLLFSLFFLILMLAEELSPYKD